MEARLPSPMSLTSPSLLQLADELWFYHSVIPFPFPSPFPSSLLYTRPDSSTLLAQLMLSSRRETRYHCHGYGDHDDAYLGESYVLKNVDQIFRPPLPLEEQEHHREGEEDLESMAGDCELESASPAQRECEASRNGEFAKQIEQKKTEDAVCQQELGRRASASASIHLKGEDALSGLYNVGLMLKDQQWTGVMYDKHAVGKENVFDVVLPKKLSKMADSTQAQDNNTCSGCGCGCRDADATCTVPYEGESSQKSGNGTGHDTYRRVMQELSCTEQDKMKENLKFWAHVVASALHSQAALQSKKARDN